MTMNQLKQLGLISNFKSSWFNAHKSTIQNMCYLYC